MLATEVVAVDGAYLCLVPVTNRDASCLDPQIVPAIPIRSIPFLIYHNSNRTSLYSNKEISQESKNVGRKRQRGEQALNQSDESKLVDIVMELKLEHGSILSDGKHLPKANGRTFQILRNQVGTSLEMPNGAKLVVKCLDSGNLALTVHERSMQMDKPSSLQVLGLGSLLGAPYWVADFCGIGGYQQLLILPDFSELVATRSGVSWDLDLAKKTLYTILGRSILTDGIHMWIPKEGEVSFSSITTYTLPKITTQDAHITYNTSSKDFSRCNSSISVTHRSDRCPHWTTAVEKVLISKLWREQREHKKQTQHRNTQNRILQKSRRAIKDIVDQTRTASSDIRLLRLRYRTQPVPPSSQDTKGSCVRLYTEFDILFQNRLSESEKSDSLQDFRLSFTPSCRNVAVATTESGIVPVFTRGDCATIISIISLEGCSIASKHLEQLDRNLEISVQAIWHSNLFQTSDTFRNKKQGAILGVFGLPMESVLLAESPVNECRTIVFPVPQGDDFTTTAIYECRKPYILTMNIAKVRSDWAVVMKSINVRLEATWNRMDWHYDGKSPTIKVTIFSCSFHGISGLIQMLRSYFPEAITNIS